MTVASPASDRVPRRPPSFDAVIRSAIAERYGARDLRAGSPMDARIRAAAFGPGYCPPWRYNRRLPSRYPLPRP